MDTDLLLYPSILPSKLVLDDHKLVYSFDQQDQFIQYTDIIGCICYRVKHPNKRINSNTAAAFNIIYYPSTNEDNEITRSKSSITFVVTRNKSLVENCKVANEWRERVLNNAFQFFSEIPPEILDAPRQVLVFVNPFSGSRIASRVFERSVYPVLAQANVNFKLVFTERALHAQDLVQRVNLCRFSAVVIVSGDGLLFEVLNGLMQRPDWREVMRRKPLAIVPGGTGNALAASIVYAASESVTKNFATHAALAIVQPKIRPLDIWMVDTLYRRYYSFLSVAWGFISDCDIGSERFRCVGSLRFTIEAILRIVGLRTYDGVLSFLPIEPYKPPQWVIDRDAAASTTTTTTATTTTAATTSAANSPDNTQQPSSRFTEYDNPAYESATPQRNLSPRRQSMELVPIEVPSTPRLTPSGDHRLTATTSAELIKECGEPPTFSGGGSAPESSIPRLSDPVPDDWVKIHDSFVTVTAVNCSHLATDNHWMPGAKIDDGCAHLSFVRAGIGKADIFELLMKLESGGHITNPAFEVVKVKAFRIEPSTPQRPPGAFMTLDGESIEYGPLQVEVVPGLARVMAR